MLLSRKNTADWDLRNELSKVNVRWALLLLVVMYFFSLFASSAHVAWQNNQPFDIFYIILLSTLTFLFNLIYNFYLYGVRKNNGMLHPVLKYLTMAADLIIITLLLFTTGGSDSMFFILYIVVLLSNGMRYGMRLAVTGVLSFNFIYFLMLFFQFYPKMEIPNFQREMLKVTGIWIVGLYIGFLARRFEILHEEVDKYKILLKKYIQPEKIEMNPLQREKNG